MAIDTQSVNVNAATNAYANQDVAAAPLTSKDIATGIQAAVNELPEAQRKELQSFVQSRSLPPGDTGEDPVDPDTEKRMKEIEQLLAANGGTFDAAKVFGRLMVELGALQRKEALTDRLNAREAARGELNSAANKLDKSADVTRHAAKVSLAMGVLGGATSIAFAGGSLKVLGGSGDTQVITSTAQSLNGAGGGLSGLMNAGGQFATTTGQATSQTLQADQNRIQAESEVTKGEGEMEAAEQQALQEFVNQIIQFIKEMRDAEVEQLAVVTRG